MTIAMMKVSMFFFLGIAEAFSPNGRSNGLLHDGMALGSRSIQQVTRKSMTTTTKTTTTRFAEREATFGMGCFWEPSESLLKVEGVKDTVVGYTGHPTATKAPTYDSVCFGRDWVEGVRVIYDDDKLSYRELLDAVWKFQKPQIGSRQYSSIIFAHSEEQDVVAQEWMQEKNNSVKDDDDYTPAMLRMSIEPQSEFYQAEGYHQQYWQKQRPRFAVIIGLIAISSGILNSITPEEFQSTVRSVANATALVIALYQLLERKIDAKVVKL